MKVKFTKLAALLLAGAALFATGCTDYEVDIQKVDKKVDDLTSGKVATLESQVAALQATVATLETAADHKADIDKLNKAISDLETALKADYMQKIQAAVDQLDAKKLDKATFETAKKAIEDALKDATDRIKAIEDKDFQKQIDDLTTAMNNALATINNRLTDLDNNKADKEQVAKDIAALKADLEKQLADAVLAVEGKIGELEKRVEANEKAIANIKEVLIPGIQEQIDNLTKVVIPKINKDIEDLQNGKVDKVDFEAYKKATANTLTLMQESIDKLTALTKGFPEDTTIKEYIDQADELLKNTFTAKYLELVAKAFGTVEDMNAMEGNLLGRLKACEALLAGDWGSLTVKQYIDGEVVKLNQKIKTLDEKVNALTERVENLEDSMETVLETLKFCAVENADGTVTYDLQGYIDDAALDAFNAACDYTDEQIQLLWEVICMYLDDIYFKLDMALQRIQSIQYVPDYDDLKITSNMAFISQPVEGEEEVGIMVVDQPTKVTYQFLPAQYAGAIAREIKQNIIQWQEAGEGPYTREILKADGGKDYIIAYFDVRPVNTRDEDAAAEDAPQFIITAVDSYDDATGEITFTVQPVNVASAQFAANAIKPTYTYTYDMYNILGWNWSGDMLDELGWNAGDYVWPVYAAEDIANYQERAAFAAQLRLYRMQTWEYANSYYPDYRYDDDVYVPINYDDDDYVDYENELASPYNVLYPGVTRIEVLPDPYKKLDVDEDEDGNKDVRMFLEEEVHQTLPYNTLRKENPAEDEDPGFRVILENAVAAAEINGKVYGLFPEDVKGGVHVINTPEGEFVIPEVKISDEAEIEYVQGGTTEPDEENYIVKPATYAEVEMNGEALASNRKLEIGNLVVGTYTFSSIMGDFPATGDVLIVKEQGSIDVSADAVWTWAWNQGPDAENLGDALVDHNLYYEEEGPDQYVRLAWPVTIDEAGAKKLMDDLGVGLEDFAGLEPDPQNPKAYVIEVADRVDEEGNEIAAEDLVFEPLADDSDFVIENVAIVDGELVADFVAFDWDKVYKITAVYELPEATITVNGLFKTYDRNREPVELDLYEYTFGINEFDEETGFGYKAGENGAAGYYYWKTPEMNQAIFDIFVATGVIDVNPEGVRADFVDFETVEDFFEGELHNKTQTYEEDGQAVAGTANKYVIIRKQTAIYGETRSNNKQISAADLLAMNSGLQSPDDPYVFLGNILYRNITSYIGEKIVIPFRFNYRVPAYDFLHQANYTFDDEGTWYTKASPKYDYNKQALKKYDVAYMNVPALAFNIIDANKRFFNYKDEMTEEYAEDYFYNKALKINFYYTGPDTVDETVLEPQSATDELTTYGDLWFNATEEAPEYEVMEGENYEHTVFYYRSIRDAIPMYGTLEIECDGVRFAIPTSFEVGSKGKYIASNFVEGGVEYSNYELRAWKPFYVPTYSQKLVVKLDEHGKYEVNVLEGLQFFDGREVAASTPVDEIQNPFVEGTYSLPDFNEGTKSYFRPMLGFNTEDGETKWGWIVGNVDNDDPSTKPGNGYAIDAPTSWDAYDLQEKSFVFDKTGVPTDLRRLIDINEQNYTMIFDYNSQIQFQDTAQISFSFDLQSPWQKFEKPFSVVVEIQGLNVQ